MNIVWDYIFIFLFYLGYNTIVLWILLAILVARYTNLFHVLTSPIDEYESNPKVENSSLPHNTQHSVSNSISVSKPYHLLLYGAIVLGMIHLSILLYLAVYLPCVRNIHGIHAWNVYHPRAVPIMIVCGFFSIFLFIRSLWPLYGWTTPFIISIELMGCLSLLHFIPWKWYL
jgi:hypothetical protein